MSEERRKQAEGSKDLRVYKSRNRQNLSQIMERMKGKNLSGIAKEAETQFFQNILPNVSKKNSSRMINKQLSTDVMTMSNEIFKNA